MSELSPRLSLPYLQPAQAQKHVTHNEALARLDMLVQLTVEAFEATVPPVDAEPGRIWALGPMPVGEWAGEGGKLAQRSFVGSWEFVAPQPGWRASMGAGLRVFDGSSWVVPDPGSLQNLPGVGIRASHDAANPLVVSGDGTLLTHDGAGHQLKVNKATNGQTASLLFQTGFSGRAEIGTAGNDDLSFKVSPDGALWRDGLVVGAVDGRVHMPNGLEVEGQIALHMGNLLGTVAQTAGAPSGAVLERGSNASGSYLRLADGTQFCMTVLDAGDPTALGAGTFEDPYRTLALVWNYPVPFVEAPVLTGHATSQSTDALDRHLLFSSALPTSESVDGVQAVRVCASSATEACSLTLLAIGRWV
ncbi:MAG: DUF2793 domain-containing protein [Roseinatronobacter sp.]